MSLSSVSMSQEAADGSSVVPLQILVIDDDEAMRRMISLALESEGFGVSVAVDGVEGLRAIEERTFDAIVLDLQMPRLDGRATFHALRERGCRSYVVIVSAFGAAAARLELGADAALPKPFDIDELFEVLQRASPPESGEQV